MDCVTLKRNKLFQNKKLKEKPHTVFFADL